MALDGTLSTEALILAINTGSSSLKFTLYAGSSTSLEPLANGAVEGLGTGKGHAWIERNGERKESSDDAANHGEALDKALSLLKDTGVPQPTMVGHRIVHGGPNHVAPERVDDALIADLKKIAPMAPLHLPAAIHALEAIAARLPEVPQVACFDTAFHATMPDVAKRLPLPARYFDKGVRRYGFHGLSYEYIMSRLGSPPPARVVIAHLGSGSSLVAVHEGRSIDTTMSFTPTGGIMMGTRTGDLDPGTLVYLLRQEKLDADALEKLVEKESGLKGIAGESDMKALLERSAGADEAAKLAVAMYGYGIRKAIGGLVAALGGIELLVFTGGIGEHAPAVRAAACAGLAGFGIDLDADRNTRQAGAISREGSPCRVQVIATDEDSVVAKHTLRVAAMH